MMKLTKLVLTTLVMGAAALTHLSSYAVIPVHQPASYGEPKLQPAPMVAVPAESENKSPQSPNRPALKAISTQTSAATNSCQINIINHTGAAIRVGNKILAPSGTLNLTSNRCNLSASTVKANVDGIEIETIHNPNHKSSTVTFSGKFSSSPSYCGNCGIGMAQVCNAEGQCACVSCTISGESGLTDLQS